MHTNNAKQRNIQRAAATARVIGGFASKVTRGHADSYQLSISNPHTNSCYDISLWDDGKPQHDFLLNSSPGQLITLQIHEYKHSSYHPWKAYDIFHFKEDAMRQFTQLDRSIRQDTARSHQQLKALASKYDRLIECQNAIEYQSLRRQQAGHFKMAVGTLIAAGCLISAPFTGGSSLLGLPTAGCLLYDGSTATDDAPTLAHLQLKHQRADLDSEWRHAQSLAKSSLDSIGQLESIINAAKLQPWKAALHGPTHGLLPHSLKQDLQALAHSQAPQPSEKAPGFASHILGAYSAICANTVKTLVSNA